MDAAMEISPAKIDGMMILPEINRPQVISDFYNCNGNQL